MMAVRLLRGTVLGAAAAGVQLIAQFAGTMHELEAVATPLLQGIQPGEGALSLVVGQGSRFLLICHWTCCVRTSWTSWHPTRWSPPAELEPPEMWHSRHSWTPHCCLHGGIFFFCGIFVCSFVQICIVFRREHKRENMFGIWLAFLVMMDGHVRDEEMKRGRAIETESE